MFEPPGDCPVCGEWVPAKAAACPDCGACAKSGWNEDDAIYDGVDLPEDRDDFDYDAWAERQLSPPRHWVLRQPWWWYVAVILFATMLWGVIHSVL